MAGCQSYSRTKSTHGRMPELLTDKKYAWRMLELLTDKKYVWQDARATHGQKVCMTGCQNYSRTKSRHGKVPELQYSNSWTKSM